MKRQSTHRLMARILIREQIDQLGRKEITSQWIEIPNDKDWNMNAIKMPTTYNGYKVLEFKLEPIVENIQIGDIFKRFGL
jgi:hypothetical protein